MGDEDEEVGMGEGKGSRLGVKERRPERAKRVERFRSSVALNSYSFKSYSGEEDGETHFSTIQFLVNICVLQCKTVDNLTGFISCNN